MGSGSFASTARFYIHDHLYSPVALTDYSGSVLERCEYDAYGNPYILDTQYAPRTTSNYGNPYLFTGRRADYLDSGSLKIQYNRNRYYDYYSGRWLTHDPLGISPNQDVPNWVDVFSQYKNGLNLYEHVRSNPLVYVDAYGLECTHDTFAIMSWLAVPKGDTPADVSDYLKTVSLVDKLVLIAELVGGSPIGFAWSLSSKDVPSTFFMTAMTLSSKGCGGDLFALTCHWACVTKTKGWWPFKKKVKESELLYCDWLKCKSPEGDLCFALPSKHGCEKRITKFFKGKCGWKVHEKFSKSDLKKIKKIIKGGKAEIDERPI
jgi:RHS repeat-associated protein